ncbi:MAG: cyclic nucleotide-binding domain-containing protein [Propionibacteriales bacterium]|nr:cyclic nucleotide-binding domain-containing protein [Propionibacteriales bacterium]
MVKPEPPEQLPAESEENAAYCLVEGVEALDRLPWGANPPPWAPGRREEGTAMGQAASGDRTWCMSEVDIFCDLTSEEMGVIAQGAPMKTYSSGELLFTPHSPVEALFILKEGRVRVFRISQDGRALTTAIVNPGTIFGEMALLGHRMYDNYAEALEQTVVCVMNQDAVRKFLLGDPRIAARITEILGKRLADMEQRLCDTIFKSVPQRVASTLKTLAVSEHRTFGPDLAVVSLTHEQIATLAGTARETTTKVLGDFADRDLIKLHRGRITVLDMDQLEAEIGG